MFLGSSLKIVSGCLVLYLTVLPAIECTVLLPAGGGAIDRVDNMKGGYASFDENSAKEDDSDDDDDEEDTYEMDDSLNPEDILNDRIDVETASRYRVHTHARLWFEAVTVCRHEGGHLATPGDEKESRLLGRLLGAAVANANITNTEMLDAMHIGIHTQGPQQKAKNLQGYAVKYSAWIQDRTNFGRQRCAGILADGRFVSLNCMENLIFVCDNKPQTNASSDQNTSKSNLNAKYKPVAGQGLYRLHLDPLPWLEAEAMCDTEGAALAVPEAGRAAGYLSGNLFARSDLPAKLQTGGVFIGINDIADEGDWVANKGNRIYLFEIWANGKPNGKRAANCAAMLPTGHYIDVSCTEPRAFLCEKKEEKIIEYVHIEGLGHYALHSSPKTWIEAALQCHAENATLAVPDSEEEAKALQKIAEESANKPPYNYKTDVSVGVHDMDGDKKWRTVDGKKVKKSGFNKWNRQESQFGNNLMACGALRDAKYNSIRCDEQFAFICEKPLEEKAPAA